MDKSIELGFISWGIKASSLQRSENNISRLISDWDYYFKFDNSKF